MTAQQIQPTAVRRYFCASAPEIAARNARIVELVGSGMSYIQAGKVVGCSRNAVAGVMNRAHNPDYRTPERIRRSLLSWERRMKWKLERLAIIQAQVEAAFAAHDVKPRYKPFLDLYAEGLTMTAISKAKGRTKERVRQILLMYGISERRILEAAA